LIGTLIKKDLLLKVKSPGGFLLLVSMPLLFALLLGLIFGPKESGETAVRVRLLTEDHDRSFASQFLTGAFGRGELAQMFEVTALDSGTGRAWMDRGKGSALLVIPKGFGRTLLDEKPAELLLIKNPGESFAPRIAEETVSILAEGGDRLFRIADGPVREIRRHIDTDTEFTTGEIAVLSVNIYLLIRRLENVLFPPQIVLREAGVDGQEESVPSSVLYVHLLAGIAIFSLLFLIEALARDFHTEHERRTLHRQIAGPVGIGTFVSSKLIFLWIAGMAAHVLVWLAACLLFGIRIPAEQFGPFVLFSAILLAALTGVIGALYGLVRKRSQIQAVAPAVILFFGMTGGAMIQIDFLPPFLKPMSVLSPIYWGQDALKKMLIENLPPSAIGMNLAVLGLAALVFNGLAMMLFSRKFRP